ncbi:F-box protein [Pyrus ussuriensis x Pyrus communis]|uniref:F-box protein n=1 Tax=Pyrus ussuriensis x Pyrus communis TaxID=2448454 RepID=A0A5N5HHQ4_9ROSA|nr:F-box protein [Pyrus ussuriensis x Pyrus communis]
MHDSTLIIMAVFDLEDERFRVIPLPKYYAYDIHGINDNLENIFEMEGCLANSWREYPIPFYTIHTTELLLFQYSRLLGRSESVFL